jgi:alpha-beta hydrolase superfamily lysophospholipase
VARRTLLPTTKACSRRIESGSVALVSDLWYEDVGSGPPVVLLHEGVVDSRIWDRVVPLLAGKLRVIRYDQRGYGRSPMWTGPYSPVDDLLSVLDAAAVQRAALVGASRGGRIALEQRSNAPSASRRSCSWARASRGIRSIST